MKATVASISILALVVCLALPVLYFAGTLTEGDLKTGFLFASVVWFAGAVMWSRKRHKEA